MSALRRGSLDTSAVSSLGGVRQENLSQFINGRPVVIDEDPYIPTERLGASIDAAREDIKRGDYVTVTRDNLDEVFGALSDASEDEVDEMFDALKKTRPDRARTRRPSSNTT